MKLIWKKLLKDKEREGPLIVRIKYLIIMFLNEGNINHKDIIL